MKNLDDFTSAYIEAALFSTNDETTEDGGQPLNLNYDAGDLHPCTLASIKSDCAKFQAHSDWQAVLEVDDVCKRGNGEYRHRDVQAGHDFWFTRQGHGCGFWDGDWAEPHGDTLTKLARSFSEQDLYLGDDLRLYIMGAEPTIEEEAREFVDTAASLEPHEGETVEVLAGMVRRAQQIIARRKSIEDGEAERRARLEPVSELLANDYHLSARFEYFHEAMSEAWRLQLTLNAQTKEEGKASHMTRVVKNTINDPRGQYIIEVYSYRETPGEKLPVWALVGFARHFTR